MSGERTTVVVAVDESQAARAALRWAADQAHLAGAPLKVVHAFQPHHLAGVFGIAKLQPDAEWRADAQQWLIGIVKEEIGDVADLELEPHVAADGPAAAVLAAAASAALDRRRVPGPRRGRLGAARLGELSRAPPRALPRCGRPASMKGMHRRNDRQLRREIDVTRR